MTTTQRSELMYAADHMSSNALNCAEIVHKFAIALVEARYKRGEPEGSSNTRALTQQVFKLSDDLFAMKASLLDILESPSSTTQDPFVEQHRTALKEVYRCLDELKALVGRLGYLGEAVLAAKEPSTRLEIEQQYKILHHAIVSMQTPLDEIAMRSSIHMRKVQAVVASRRLSVPIEEAETICARQWQ